MDGNIEPNEQLATLSSMLSPEEHVVVEATLRRDQAHSELKAIEAEARLFAEAQADLAGAEKALREHLFEGAVAETPDPRRQAKLAAAVRDARARVAKHQDWNERGMAAKAAVEREEKAILVAVKDAVRAKAEEFGNAYRTAAEIALQAEAALNALAGWATVEQQDVPLSETIRGFIRPQDPRQLEREEAERRTALAECSAEWWAYPKGLLTLGREGGQ